MFVEWLRHLLTPCPRHLRRMGYLRELIAIDSRYRRNREAWAPHLEACRETVMEAAELCRNTRKATVFGSGLLLDVPLAALAKRFDEVVLVDLLHLREARCQAKSFPNVRLVASDVTGVAAAVHAGGLPLAPGGALSEADADLVVSLNLLSQLPLLPVAWASHRHPSDAVKAFARTLVEGHLEALTHCPGTVCLIAETERRICDGETVLETEDPLHGVALPPATREWTWNLAPRPEVDKAYDVRLRVRAVLGEKGLPPAGEKDLPPAREQAPS